MFRWVGWVETLDASAVSLPPNVMLPLFQAPALLEYLQVAPKCLVCAVEKKLDTTRRREGSARLGVTVEAATGREMRIVQGDGSLQGAEELEAISMEGVTS